MQPNQLEIIRIMVRFKLQVRRLLDQAVDLDQLASDTEYARLRLADIEALSQDEDLLIMLVQLRNHLLGSDAGRSLRTKSTAPAGNGHAANEAAPALRHKYLYGARG
jgi:hypothetical protein